MVRKAPVLVDRYRAGRGRYTRRGNLVVDAPADVVCPCLAAVRPPCVLFRLRVDAAKDVDEAQFVEHARKPRPFFWQKTRVLLVAAPVLEVDRLMRDIPVTAKDDLALLPAELEQVRQEAFQKAKFGRLAMRSGRPGRQVDTDDGELSEVGLEIAAFGVEFGATESGGYLGQTLGVQRDPRVALARGRTKEAMCLSR